MNLHTSLCILKNLSHFWNKFEECHAYDEFQVIEKMNYCG